jgi:hypothetical protein
MSVSRHRKALKALIQSVSIHIIVDNEILGLEAQQLYHYLSDNSDIHASQPDVRPSASLTKIHRTVREPDSGATMPHLPQ